MQKLVFILLFLLITVVSKAQLSVGYRYGIGSHGVNFLPEYLETFQIGYVRSSHGLSFTYNNEKNAGFQIELNYAEKGWKEEFENSPDTFYIRDIEYLEIPLFSHFEIGHRMLRPTVVFGPYFGWKLNESYTQNGFDGLLASDLPHYVEEIRSLDFGIKVGVGLKLNLGRFAVFGEVRYDLEMVGSRDIFSDKPSFIISEKTEEISISRLTEISGVFGIMWHILPQKEKTVGEGYTPKEDVYLNDY